MKQLSYIRINDKRTLDLPPGNTLHKVLSQYRIIPLGCRGLKKCKRCICVIPGLPHTKREQQLLSAEEKLNDRHLACEVLLYAGHTLNVGVSGESLFRSRTPWKVISSNKLTNWIKELILEQADSSRITWEPGDCIDIDAQPYDLDLHISSTHFKAQHRHITTRTYSLANAPQDKNQLVLLIRLAPPPLESTRPLLFSSTIPPGIVSTYLFSLVPGNIVMGSYPYNHFHLRVNNRQKIYIGAGVGLAPLRSHLLHLASDNFCEPIHLFYGARNEPDLLYHQELLALSSSWDAFCYHPTLSAPHENWKGCAGHVQKHLENYLQNQKTKSPEKSDYYICGPSAMQIDVIRILKSFGVDNQYIYIDDFETSTKKDHT